MARRGNGLSTLSPFFSGAETDFLLVALMSVQRPSRSPQLLSTNPRLAASCIDDEIFIGYKYKEDQKGVPPYVRVELTCLKISEQQVSHCAQQPVS